jgi:uncharacterized lipoprotein
MQSWELPGKWVCRAVVLAFLVTSAGGCALTKENATLTYVPQGSSTRIDGSHLTPVCVIVTDVRDRKDQVGCKKNGYGMEMAAIISTNDVPQLVAGAITDELRSCGFQIGQGGTCVAVELMKFYNDFKIGFWSGSADSEVTFAVQVKKSGGNIIYAKSIAGHRTNGGIFLASAKNAKEALEPALQDAIAKLFIDQAFISALKQAGQ